VTPWRITTDVDVAILSVTGELVTDTASELTAAAAAVLTGYRVTHLVVDLVRVASLDMVALKALLH
jgi:anti-anti-sigma regulatory factor